MGSEAVSFVNLIPKIVEIVEAAGFLLEDDSSGTDLRFGYRDHSWFGADEASPVAIEVSEVARRLLTAWYGNIVTVSVECVDDWASLLVKAV